MKKINLFIVCLSFFAFSCSNSGNNKHKEDCNKNTEISENNEEISTDKDQNKDDFQLFWQNLQDLVAKNDIKAIHNLCKEEYKSSYSYIFDDKMKEEISKTKFSDLQSISGNKKYFQYSISYPADENGQVFESTFGFYIEKIDGKWMLTEPIMAG